MTDIQGFTTPSVLAVTLMAPDGMNSTSFTESLLGAVLFDAQKEQHLIRGGGPLFLPASPNNIAKMRNRAAQILLDETSADWLLFIDSDMGFDEDAVYALLAAADPEERPVIGALCFGMFKTIATQGGWKTKPFPTLYDWTNHEDGTSGFTLRADYPHDTVTAVAATGAAFLMIHRSVLELMREGAGDTWFDRAKVKPEEELMGEDISFCARLGALGIPVFVHTGVHTNHLKAVWVDEEYYLGQRALHAISEEAAAKVASDVA